MANSDLKISDLDEHAVMGAVPGGIKCGRFARSDHKGGFADHPRKIQPVA